MEESAHSHLCGLSVDYHQIESCGNFHRRHCATRKIIDCRCCVVANYHNPAVGTIGTGALGLKDRSIDTAAQIRGKDSETVGGYLHGKFTLRVTVQPGAETLRSAHQRGIVLIEYPGVHRHLHRGTVDGRVDESHNLLVACRECDLARIAELGSQRACFESGVAGKERRVLHAQINNRRICVAQINTVGVVEVVPAHYLVAGVVAAVGIFGGLTVAEFAELPYHLGAGSQQHHRRHS